MNFGTLHLVNAVIRNNSATNYGGAINNNSSSAFLYINNSIIKNNTAGIFGGGIITSTP